MITIVSFNTSVKFFVGQEIDNLGKNRFSKVHNPYPSALIKVAKGIPDMLN
jgi:hypothetical protein